jgi:hypothetical protein
MTKILKYIDNEEMGIRSTDKTPFVWFMRGGELTIKGRSIPEDGTEFYENLFKWTRKYILNPSPSTILSVELEYLNDITSHYLLKIIKDLSRSCAHFSVEWIYKKGDDDILEMGEILESSSKAQFIYNEVLDS